MIKQQFIDYFKLFKIFQLKKLEKTGQVKIVQDKILMRKILSVQGTVSTQNFTTMNCSNHPNIHFRQQYLYILGYNQPGKSLTFQISYYLLNKQYRLICSTMYKEEFKRKSDNLFHYQLKLPTDKWTVLVLDLYSLVNWENSFKNDQDIRIGFRISNIEIRANSKIKGIFQSQTLYGPHNLPKDMEFPLRPEQNFFQKYFYLVAGLNLTEELKTQIQEYKQKSIKNELHQKGKQLIKETKTSKNKIIPENTKIQEQKSIQQKKQQKSKNKLTREKRDLSKQKLLKNQQKSLKKSYFVSGTKRSKIENQRKQKKNNHQNKEQFSEVNKDDEGLQQQQVLQAPKPAASINLSIKAIQAISVVDQNIVSCQSFLTQPVMLKTHKKITKIHKSRLGKVLTGYQDGSVCLWDTIRKEQLFYFKSQLESIKTLLMDYQQNIIIVGLDKLKRQVIEIISNDQAIIFKQISTFNIKSIHLVSEESFQLGLISIGYENVRIWTISPNNYIINGYSIYLGKMARNITYNDCCIVQTVNGSYGFICDSQGYVTKINIHQKKMQGVIKVDNCGIDHIRLIKYLNNEQKILVCNQKGIIKLLSCVTMETQLQYPINHRVKSLFLKYRQSSENHHSNNDVPILLIQTYKKTLAQLDLVESTFHFNLRSHYQQVTHIQCPSSAKTLSGSSFQQNKIVTASLDSTMRIWKSIKVNDQQLVLKEEYQFLINGQIITHLVMTPLNKKNNQFVYIVTDSNKIRKINCNNYQIAKQFILPTIGNIDSSKLNNNVVSMSINQQGKFILVVSSNQVLLMNDELEVVQFKDLCLQNENSNSKRMNFKKESYKQKDRMQLNCLSGFNSYKKCLFFENPLSSNIQFYDLKDLSKQLFKIQSQQGEKNMNIEWDHDFIHLITQNQYQLYENDNLLKIIPLATIQNQGSNSKRFQLKFITMCYPLVCKSYRNQQNGQNFIELQILNKNGLTERIKMPEPISHLKISRPYHNQSQYQHLNQNDWQGQIVCAGEQSFGMYLLKYKLLNFDQNLLSFNDLTGIQQQTNNNHGLSGNSQMQGNKKSIDTQNLSIFNNKMQNTNNLDISFSQTATLLIGGQKNNFFEQNQFLNSNINNQPVNNAPAQLRKLYEEQEKMFEQCKKAVFGNYFDDGNDENNNDNILNQNQTGYQYEDQNSCNREYQSGSRIKMRIFYGIESRQSLLCQNSELSFKYSNKNTTKNETGQFYWNSSQQQVTLFTNDYKSLLVHEFTQPKIHHRLIHLYTKPTSICWSYADISSSESQSQSSTVNYLIVCNNSIIKLYNTKSKCNYIRTIEIDLLIKDKHVIFSSFITNCNSYLVVLTYKINQKQRTSQNNIKSKKNNNSSNKSIKQQASSKLYIFVIDISSGKVVSSSYHQPQFLPSSGNKSTTFVDNQRNIRQTYSLAVNRYTANKKLQFVLLGKHSVSFYRVTSMFTLQTLQLQEIYPITKQKTEGLTCAKFIKVQEDIYLLIGTQNGSVVLVDSRTGAIILVLMNLLSNGGNSKSLSSISCRGISKIEFISEQYNSNIQLHCCSKLIFFTQQSNFVKVIPLENGLNTLINQIQHSVIAQNQIQSTTIIENNSFSNSAVNYTSNASSSAVRSINLDSQITAISSINNHTQQLILTKSCTLWLVDYDDYCSIKIFSTHQHFINEAYLLSNPNQLNQKSFISCSQDGYIKVTDLNKIQQGLQIYKPRKKATCIDIKGKYTVCGFKDQIYFYDALLVQDIKNISYLGSLQFESQGVIKVKNISYSDNYYVLTDKKVYIIYVKRKQAKSNNSMLKSQLSMNSQRTSKLDDKSSQISGSITNSQQPQSKLQKVLIQIQIQQISSFQSTNQQSSIFPPLDIEINPYKLYDQFSITFKGGKIDVWQRKCLKRTLNPLQQLSSIHQLEYYLIDVYNRKQILQPSVQFISETQYIVALSELNKIEVRNFKEHSIIKEIIFNQNSFEGIKTFNYINSKQIKQYFQQQTQKSNKTQHLSHLNDNINSLLKKGSLLLIGDQYGYLNICDLNGLVLDKQKIFSGPIQSIQVENDSNQKGIAFNLLLKSSRYISFLQILN